MRTRHLLALTLLLAGAAQAQDLNTISGVEAKEEGGVVVVTVKGSRPPNFTTFSMADPPRFVIDLSESHFNGVAETITVDDGVLSVIKNLSYGSGPTAIARVMVAFALDVEPPEVAAAGNDLVIRVVRPGSAPAAVAQGEAAQPAQAAEAGTVVAEPDAAQAKADAEAKAQVEAELRAQAEQAAQAEAEAQQRAREEAEAQAKADAQAQAAAEAQAQAQAEEQAREAAAARAAEIKARAEQQVAAEPAQEPAGDKVDDSVVVAPAAEAPAEQPQAAEPAPVDAAAQAREDAAARARAQAEAAEAARRARAEAAAQARADAEARRAAELQAKADAKARALQDAKDRKAAEQAAREQAKVDAAAKKAADLEAKRLARQEAEAARLAAIEARKAEKAARLAATGPAAKIREIGFKQLPGASRVYFRTTVAPKFTVTDVGDSVVRVELQNTRAGRRNDTRFLDTSFFASPVALISPSLQGSSFVVEIKLKQRVPYQQKVEGDLLALDFERPQAAPAAAARPSAEAPVDAIPGDSAPAEPAAGAEVDGAVVAPEDPAPPQGQ